LRKNTHSISGYNSVFFTSPRLPATPRQARLAWRAGRKTGSYSGVAGGWRAGYKFWKFFSEILLWDYSTI